MCIRDRYWKLPWCWARGARSVKVSSDGARARLSSRLVEERPSGELQRFEAKGAREDAEVEQREPADRDRHDVRAEDRDQEALAARTDHAARHHEQDHQRQSVAVVGTERGVPDQAHGKDRREDQTQQWIRVPVSYTHLTLP